MVNMPEVKVGIVAVSRDCFPIDLAERRRKAVVKALNEKGVDIFEVNTIIEGGIDANVMDAYEEIKAADVNALVVYLGNFGPEGPETLIAKKFGGPVMYVAAAEENIGVLSSERGDAYCGMLNASYNLKLNGITAYIPEFPVGHPIVLDIALGNGLIVGPLFVGTADDLVVDVGKVLDEGHLVAAVFQIAAHDIEHADGSCVADVDVVIHGRSASVHLYFAGGDGDEFFFLSGEGVVDFHSELLSAQKREKIENRLRAKRPKAAKTAVPLRFITRSPCNGGGSADRYFVFSRSVLAGALGRNRFPKVLSAGHTFSLSGVFRLLFLVNAFSICI